MAVTHLSELEGKHRDLELQIKDEMSHANIDSLRIAELKRRKLQIKEQIVRLRTLEGQTLH